MRGDSEITLLQESYAPLSNHSNRIFI